MPTTRTRLFAFSLSVILSLAIMTLARLKAPFDLFLADRFLPGAGWVEIGLLAIYAGILAAVLAMARDTRKIRRAIWLTFSCVFFLQFAAGLLGANRLLMTGALHVPVPAVVIAGPIFRGARFFMPILFVSTVFLVGPAWCSYLCYFGAWDGLAASRVRRPVHLTRAWTAIRVSVLVMTPVVAVILRLAGVQQRTAGWIAVGFGAGGLLVSLLVSRRSGTMAHCTSYCPLGLVSNLVGKASRFRLRISSDCDACGACISSCRYQALTPETLRRRRPGLTCSLCGDCLHSCAKGALRYHFPGLKPHIARALFVAIAAALHASFLGIARI